MDEVTIPIGQDSAVSGLWLEPMDARACLVLAHGAGAGMTHPSMASIANGLAERRIASLRFQFPFMERGSRRPDPPMVAHPAVRAAVEKARELGKHLPLFAGGRSFGGRMTSQAQAIEPLGICGLVFFAFPLHPAGKPSTARAEHLSRIEIPMLFLQGTRDALAQTDLLDQVIAGLGQRATLVLAEGADHSFKVPATASQNSAAALRHLLDAAAHWMTSL